MEDIDQPRSESQRPDRGIPAHVSAKRCETLNTPQGERKLHHGQHWGDWRLDGERLTLDYKPGGIWRYEVDLERIHDSASLVDWIFQVHGHSFHLQWSSDVMQDLLTALDDIFRPQANLCSMGRDKRLRAGFVSERIEPPIEAERAEMPARERAL